jgi:hypothetical protein
MRDEGEEVSGGADIGVEWRESERRSFLTFALDCEPFLDDVGAMSGKSITEGLKSRKKFAREGLCSGRLRF